MKKQYKAPEMDVEMINSEDIMSLSPNSSDYANNSEKTFDYSSILNGDWSI